MFYIKYISIHIYIAKINSIYIYIYTALHVYTSIIEIKHTYIHVPSPDFCFLSGLSSHKGSCTMFGIFVRCAFWNTFIRAYICVPLNENINTCSSETNACFLVQMKIAMNIKMFSEDPLIYVGKQRTRIFF